MKIVLSVIAMASVFVGVVPALGQEKRLSERQALDLNRRVTVRMTVVDDETGLPLQSIAIQAGKFDPETPDKITWGYTLTRTRSTTGNYSTSVEWGRGWTARVLVDGYIPQPVLTKAPKPDDQELNVELRMKRGRVVTGRVLDHQGQPIDGATIYPVGPTGINVYQGQAYHSWGDPDDQARGVVTDKQGRFELPAGDVKNVVVTCRSFNAWPATVPENAEEELVIRLPEPARITVTVQVEGSEKKDEIFYQLLMFDVPEFKGVESTRRVPLPESGELVLEGMTPGKYQICRTRSMRYGEMGNSAMLNREFLEVRPGEEYQYKVVRPNGARVTGVVSWPEVANPIGIIVSVTAKEPTLQPGTEREYLEVHDARLAGRFDDNPHGGAALTNGKAPFLTERIPPGTYRVRAEGYAALTEQQRFRSGLIPPRWTAEQIITVPEDGDVPLVRLEFEEKN